jgi:hypothetical protein
VPWRRGTVDIASASGTRRPGFESRLGIRFLGEHSSAVMQNYLICIVCVLKREMRALATKKFNFPHGLIFRTFFSAEKSAFRGKKCFPRKNCFRAEKVSKVRLRPGSLVLDEDMRARSWTWFSLTFAPFQKSLVSLCPSVCHGAATLVRTFLSY